MSVRTKQLRVLIAEREEFVRRGLCALLQERQGWKVCGEASTGAETIQRATLLHPDLILLDVSMPDMEVTKTIGKTFDACPTARIVALANQDSAELAVNALTSGAMGVVLKSEPASELTLTVERVVNGQSCLSPGAVTLMRDQLAKRLSPGPSLASLSGREIEIFESLAKGKSNKEVAATLNLSVKTVNAHRANIMRKLALRSYSELIHFAIRHGFVLN